VLFEVRLISIRGEDDIYMKINHHWLMQWKKMLHYQLAFNTVLVQQIILFSSQIKVK